MNAAVSILPFGITLSTSLLADGDGSQVMTPGPKKGASPLWALAFSGRTECLELLLMRSCDIHLCTDDGRSPVYVAAEKGHAECTLKCTSCLPAAMSTSVTTTAGRQFQSPLHPDTLRECHSFLRLVQTDEVIAMEHLPVMVPVKIIKPSVRAF